MQSSLFLVVALAFVALVNGHAKLVDPLPWGNQPDKTNPCGAGAPATSPDATWHVGDQVNIQWQVIAGDGAGEVFLAIDPAGGETFPANKTDLGSAPSVQAQPYSFPYTVPNIQCTGLGANLCTIQVSSSSNWFGCSTVRILQPGQTPPPPAENNCVVPNSLIYCTFRNHLSVSLPPGQTYLAMDHGAQLTYSATINNQNVFSTGNSSACQKSYKNYLCLSALPNCGDKEACKSACTDMVAQCGLTAAHQSLYDCTTGPNSCTGLASAIRVSFAVLFVAVVAALF